MTQLRAVLWAAVSSQPQVNQISLPQQIADMKAICAKSNWVVIDVLQVPGHSRSEANIVKMLAEYRQKGIDAYERLQEHWAAEDFEILIAYDPSRLARSMPLFTWIATCTLEIGAAIHFVIGGSPIADADTSDFQIALGSISATAGIKRLVKLRDAKMDEFAARGLPTTNRHNPAYILQRDDRGRMTGLKLDESKRVMWQDLARLLLDGCEYNNLELRMAALGHVNPKTGNPYYYGFFYRWLHQPSTWGHTARNMPQTTWQGRSWPYDETQQPPEGVKLWRNTHMPVFTGELADQVKAELARRNRVNGVIRGRARPNTRFAFSGLLYCESCGSRLIANIDSKRDPLVYWVCPRNRPSFRSHFADFQRCPARVSISNRRVTEKIDHFLREILAMADPNLAFEVPDPDHRRRIADLEGDLARTERKVRAIAQKLADPEMDQLTSIFNSELSAANERIRQIRRELATIERQPDSEEIAHRRMRTLAKLDISQFWNVSPMVQNQTLRKILGERHRFVVSPDKRLFLAAKE